MGDASSGVFGPSTPAPSAGLSASLTSSLLRAVQTRAMSFLFEASYHKVNQKNGVSPFQNLCACLGGSAIQTVGDNPVTAYRQLVQQFAKNAQGQTVSPKEAVAEANAVFRAAPISASLSGLWPRMIGVLLKRVPKFGFLLGGHPGGRRFAGGNRKSSSLHFIRHASVPPPQQRRNTEM